MKQQKILDEMVNKPPILVVGIAGASSSGKTRLLKSLLIHLNSANVVHFDLDGYHLHTREERKRLNEYPDEIEANSFEKIIKDIDALIAGNSVKVPVYDHKTGVFLKPINLFSKKIIFAEGLHACLINTIAGRMIIDVSIFLSPDENLRKR